MKGARFGTGTISFRLLLGFGAVLVLLGAALVAEWISMASLTGTLGRRMADVYLDSQLAAQLSANINQVVESGARYVTTHDSASQVIFQRAGWEAHRLERALERQPNQSPEVLVLLAAIEDSLSTMEVRSARAHRLTDLGRPVEARAAAEGARATSTPLLGALDQLGTLKARSVAQAGVELKDGGTERSILLITAIAIALVVATAVLLGTVRSITQPLEALVAHAKGLRDGDLSVRTSRKMPGEFQILASAMNQLSTSLSRIVTVTAATADDVAVSANELSTVSEQISLTASQMAAAMAEVSEGAESQVRQIRTVDGALRTIRDRADGVRNGAADVNSLAKGIEHSAAEKRAEIQEAMGILLDVRTKVQTAYEQSSALDQAAAGIKTFASTVSRIAEQTSLLALNATIAAARAGPAGRGFAIVADEVRKLSVQAEDAAADIAKMTALITERVASTSAAMSAGAERVAEIERVSRSIDEALSSIAAAATRMRAAANAVTMAASENAVAVESASGGVASITRTAEGHAAAAQEVSASTEEQSAACEQMSSASATLLEGSTQLRQLVGGLKTHAA